MSTILSTYSIMTGQDSSQARHMLQDHRTSSSITGPTMFSPTSGSSAAVAVRLRADALRDHLVLVLVEVVAQVEEELARRQRLAGGRGGALRRAAAALRAAEHVEHLLPA